MIMPLNCCVPGCRGNYRGTKEHPEEKVSVFRFPNDSELRAKWIRMIPRENLQVTENTVVCEKHFFLDFIVRVDCITRDDGSVLSVPRKIPKLTVDAYPSVFPNTPSYLSEEPAKKRKTLDSRRAEVDVRDEVRFQDWLSNDKICDFNGLSQKLDSHIMDYSDWIISRSSEYICIYRVELTHTPRIIVAIRIDRVLHVDAFKGELKLDSHLLEWILGKDCIIGCWSQLSLLLSHLSGLVDKDSDFSILDTVACIQRALDGLCNRLN